jgi:hypothetical protein
VYRLALANARRDIAGPLEIVLPGGVRRAVIRFVAAEKFHGAIGLRWKEFDDESGARSWLRSNGISA